MVSHHNLDIHEDANLSTIGLLNNPQEKEDSNEAALIKLADFKQKQHAIRS